MTLLFSDDFNRANSTNLGSSWTEDLGDWAITSNQLGAGGSGDIVVYWNGSTGTTDYASEAKIYGKDNWQGVLARRTTNNTFYIIDINTSRQMLLERSAGGSWTTLQTITSPTISDGDTLKLEVSGTGATVTLKVYRNGSQIGTTQSDTSGSRITSQGYAGLYVYNGITPAFDDFAVNDLSSGTNATLSAALAAATALSLASSLQSGSALAGQLGTATAISPNSSFASGGVLAAAVSLASALSASSTLTGASPNVVLAAVLALATAQSGSSVMLSGVVLPAGVTLGSALSPSGVFASGGVVMASLTTAAAASLIASFQMPPGTGNLFNDGFESGDTSAWTETLVDTGGSLTVGASYKYAGSYGLRAYISGTPAYAMVSKNQSTPSTNLIACKARIKLVQATDDSSGVIVMQLQNTSYQAMLNFVKANGSWYITGYGKDTVFWSAALDPQPDLSTFQNVEITYQFASQPVARCYINGTQAATYTDTSTGTAHSLLRCVFGVTNWVGGTQVSETYIDAAALSDAYIGMPAVDGTLTGQAVAATGLSPNSSFLSGGVLAALLAAATALSPSPTLKSGCVLGTAAGMATALSSSAGLQSSSVMSAALTTSSATSLTGIFSGVSANGLLLAGLPAANAVSPVVSFRAQRIVIGRGMLRSGGRMAKIGSGTR